MARACRRGLLPVSSTAHRAGMVEISPELAAAMLAYAEEAAAQAPPLSDEQIRELRAALRPEPVSHLGEALPPEAYRG